MKFLNSKKGYTLMELLVVIGIIAVFLSIVIPIVSGVISTSRLRMDRNLAESYQTAIKLWMSETPSAEIVYYSNLDDTNTVGGSHNEISYTNAYMGTQQLPGIEFTTQREIRDSAITAIKSLTKEKLNTQTIGDLYLEHPKSIGYGYKYYYLAGVISVERTDSTKDLYSGDGYEYYIWLDYQPTASFRLGTEPIPKYEKIEGATSSNVAKPTFSFEFSLQSGDDVNSCVFAIENENCSYTLSGKNISPRVFVPDKYHIKYYYAGSLRYEGYFDVTQGFIFDGKVLLSFADSTMQSSTSVSYFTRSGGTITKCTSQEDVIIVPSSIGGIPITTIGANAFNNLPAKKIIIPASVTTIEALAINSCPNLQYLSLPSPTLKSKAINHCVKLSTVDFSLPNDYITLERSVETDAFYYCPSLRNLSFPSVYRTFSATAFDWLTTANTNNFKVSIALTPEECPIALQNDKTHVKFDFPSRNYFAISGTKMKLNTNATIADSDKILAIPYRLKNASGTMQKSSIIAGSLTYSASEKNKLATMRTKFEKLIIDEGYVEIEQEAFKTFKVTSISLPSTLKVIGSEAFYGHTALSVEIPEGVTSVGARAFASEDLQTISIKCSSTALNNQSLAGCNRVKTVIFYDFDGDKNTVKPEDFGLKADVKLIFA